MSVRLDPSRVTRAMRGDDESTKELFVPFLSTGEEIAA